MSNNAHELSNRLLNALDNNYNVVDMHAVNEIISILEKINITKELLETTRLGKHVNELRRKTSDPTLARRAKVLVKRWRDLVIPAAASPLHTGSNRSSAERQARRLGNTPITSPAFARQVVSPAVPSPRPPSRPAWGGYESDSNDVILVDDEPAPAPAPALAQLTPPKRPPSPEAPQDEKKTKRDKKPKKRRGHRAEAAAGAGAWAGRNGDARGNGVRLDPYAALVHRLPPAGAKKVKTTKELLAQIQSQSRGAPRSPASPASPASPDVMLVEPDEPSPVKAESPLRNGGSPAPPPPPARPAPSPPAPACGCGDRADPACAAAPRAAAPPAAVRALHHALLPGVNGTRAPPLPARYAVRPLVDPARPELFASVVPLYRYSDHADDRCVKNMSRIPLCEHLPWTEFAPAPPSPPPRAAPPPPRPYPQDSPEPEDRPPSESVQPEEIEPAAPTPAELADRLKPPLIAPVDENVFRVKKCESVKTDVADEFASEQQEHRTVERTKPTLDGAALYALCQQARRAVPYGYELVDTAPVLALPTDAAAPELGAALAAAAAGTARDALGRPEREPNFAEWHESAVLGDLIALPYVVLD